MSESYAISAIKYDNRYWLIDKNGKALEEATSSGIQNVIPVSGIEAQVSVQGDKLNVKEGDSAKFDYLVKVLTGLVDAGIQDRVLSIDVANISNIRFDYGGRFTVELGSGENIDYKLQLLETVISKLNENDKGVINLSVDKEAHFTPK